MCTAAKEQEGWAVTSEDRAAGVIEAGMTMPLTGWTHQLRITVKKRSNFVSRVYMVSYGEDSPGDLGQNARNIEGYFVSLDHRLGAASVE